MKWFPASILSLALAVGLAAHPVSAQQQPLTDARVEALMIGAFGMSGGTLAKILEWRRNLFAILDVDRDGAITNADADRQAEESAAAQRADIIGKILQFDLNADGAVTLDEAKEAWMLTTMRTGIALVVGAPSASMNKQIEAAAVKTMQTDTNKDGRIDAAEMLAVARQATAAGVQMSPVMAAALYVDEDGDGRTTLAEFLKPAEALFRKIDTNGDGVVSAEELAAYRKANAPTRTFAPKPAPR
jgi:Ca2+-binding EF-hand superfamily protein